jgi:hypothetical protein
MDLRVYDQEASLESHAEVNDVDESSNLPELEQLLEEIDRDESAGPGAPGRSVQLRGAGRAVPGRDGSTGVHAAATHGISGSAGHLPHFDRIQRSFGRHDVAGIQAHVGGAAAEGARAMGAEAFAAGDHVAFAGAPDLHTAAHEAAHVVQQRAGVQLKGGVGEAGDGYERHADEVADLVVQGRSSEALLDRMAGGGAAAAVQRKIKIGGRRYNPTRDLNLFRRRGGARMVEIVTTMHNNGNDPTFAFDNARRFCEELKMRVHATRAMTSANQGNLRYRHPHEPRVGQLDDRYWVAHGGYQFTLQPRARPARAIRSIFEGGHDNVLECNSTMVACHYYAMLKTMGDDAFNRRFAGGQELVISPYHKDLPGTDRPHPFDGRLMRRITIAGEDDLLPGDWVYFKNFDDYIQKHPNGFWSGEHTMYLGGGEFQGFGTAVSSAAEINQKLLDNYNAGLPPPQQKQIGDIPGMLLYARRPVMQRIIT